MRTNKALFERLTYIWGKYFPDVPKSNKVIIQFGRKAHKRLGSIRRINIEENKCFDTQILINGYFRDKKVPQFVIDATIAHELAHYTHGFSSPLPRLSPYPHRGGMVDKELDKRGLSYLVEQEMNWLDENWEDIEN